MTKLPKPEKHPFATLCAYSDHELSEKRRKELNRDLVILVPASIIGFLAITSLDAATGALIIATATKLFIWMTWYILIALFVRYLRLFSATSLLNRAQQNRAIMVIVVLSAIALATLATLATLALFGEQLTEMSKEVSVAIAEMVKGLINIFIVK